MSKSLIRLFVLFFLVASWAIAPISPFKAIVTQVKAQTSVVTSAFISVEPNPVEVGQWVRIDMWIEPAPPTPTEAIPLVITMVHPNGTSSLLGPFTSYPNGSATLFYMVTQVGTLTLHLNYSGQYFANSTIWYMPSMSTATMLNVTQEPTQVIQQIRINADGSIIPPTAPISTIDNVTYTLTEDIHFNFSILFKGALRVERDNIIINGAGHILRGLNDGYGIELTSPSFTGQYNVTIANTTITQFYIGIYIAGSSNTIIGNNITNNGDAGVLLGSSFGNYVTSNNIVGNGGDGIYLYYSSHNNVATNNITNNGGNGVSCYASPYSDSHGINISSNHISGNNKGIYFFLCSNNTISKNDIANNRDHGICAVNSSGNYMYANGIKNNSNGFDFCYSLNNRLYENDVSSNRWFGIFFISVCSTDVYANNITSNWIGLEIDGEPGTAEARNNTVVHNNFVNNVRHAYSFGASNCTWDDGYPSGGNYWSDYNGTDTNADGIGDTPYFIFAEGMDRYPLMNPFVVETPQSPSLPPSSFPSPLPGRSPSASLIPSPTPSQPPSSPLSLTSEQPKQSPQPQPRKQQTELNYATVADVIAIAIVAVTAMVLKKRRGKNIS
jgi:parallel beta-helix repeat protein